MPSAVIYIKVYKTANFISIFRKTWAAFNFQYVKRGSFLVLFTTLHEVVPQALVSFKKYMPPPLPYFKVNMCPLPLPLFASIFFSYLWSFRWPKYIVTLPRYFSLRLPHLNINTGPPQTNWTRIFSESRIFYFSVNETDTVTSGPF